MFFWVVSVIGFVDELINNFVLILKLLLTECNGEEGEKKKDCKYVFDKSRLSGWGCFVVK